MATDFISSKKQVTDDLTSVVYKNYMQGQWGIEVGYNTVPDWYAYMRRSQLEWLEEQDCSNALGSLAGNQYYQTPIDNWSCSYPHQSVKYDPTAPNGVCFCQIAVGFPPVYEITPQSPVNTITYQDTPYYILTTSPVPGINPFPPIECCNKCGEHRFNLNPTALFIEFNSREYGSC